MTELKPMIQKMSYVKDNKIKVFGISAMDIEKNPYVVEMIDND